MRSSTDLTTFAAKKRKKLKKEFFAYFASFCGKNLLTTPQRMYNLCNRRAHIAQDEFMLNNTPVDRSFEKFRGGPTPLPSQVIRITLNRQGHIYFNANA